MSCFRQQQTDLNDKTCLVDTLKNMGFNPQVNEQKVTVRGHGSETKKAEIILRKEDLKDGGDIGFSLTKDGSYSLVGDEYVLRNSRHKLTAFSKELKVQYADTKVRRLASNANLMFIGVRSIEKDGKQIRQMQFKPMTIGA